MSPGLLMIDLRDIGRPLFLVVEKPGMPLGQHRAQHLVEDDHGQVEGYSSRLTVGRSTLSGGAEIADVKLVFVSYLSVLGFGRTDVRQNLPGPGLPGS